MKQELIDEDEMDTFLRYEIATVGKKLSKSNETLIK